MKKRAGFALLLSLLVLTGCNSPKPPASNAPDQDPSAPGDIQTAAPDLQDFHSIQVDLLAANVQIQTGEDWSVRYRFSDKEILNRCEVQGDTLYVETSFNLTEPYRHKDWFLEITVPGGTVLQDIEVESVAGDILLRNLLCTSADLESTSGHITTETVTTQELEMASISGDLSTLDTTAEQLDANSTSGSLSLAGFFGSAETETVSGNITLTGSLSQGAEAETVSGDIALTVNHPLDVDARTIGGICLNGEDRPTKNLSLRADAPLAQLESVSGRIEIEITN